MIIEDIKKLINELKKEEDLKNIQADFTTHFQIYQRDIQEFLDTQFKNSSQTEEELNELKEFIHNQLTMNLFNDLFATNCDDQRLCVVEDND